MATSLATYSAFALNNRPAVVEINRNGSVNLNGSSLPASVSQHWIPSIDNTFDLGQNTTPLRWRDLWLSRNASVVGTVTAGALTVGNNAIFTNGAVYIGGAGLSNYNGNTPNIGTNGSGRWGALWITDINCTQSLFAGTTSVTSLAVTGPSNASFYGPIYPGSAGAIDIGASALPWKDLYITGNIYKNGVLYNPGVSNIGDLLPAVHNVYNVGSGALNWKNIYFSGSIFGGGLITTNGDIESVNGNLKIYNGYGSFGTDVTVGATGTGNLSVSGSIIMNGNNQLRPATNNFGTIGTSALSWNNLYTTNGSIEILTPSLAGVPTPGTYIGTATKVYNHGYIYNVNAMNMMPLGAAGALGASGNRWKDVFALNVNASTSLTAPSSHALDWSTYTPNVEIGDVALSANQQLITTSNIKGIYMGSPVEVNDLSVWKWALNPAVTVIDANVDGRYCVFNHEYRFFPYGTGAICYVKMLLKVNSFSAGGGVPSIVPFMIMVDYQLSPVVKTKTGQWCGTAQYLQWGQFANDFVGVNNDSMRQPQRAHWFQRQGQGAVIATNNDGRVAIFVEPYSNSQPALGDRFTITATFFI